MKTTLLVIALLLIVMAGGAAFFLYGRIDIERENGNISSLSVKVDKLAEDYKSVTDWYFSYNKKVESLSDEVSGWEEKIGSLGTFSDEVSDKLGDVKKGIFGVKRDLKLLKERLEEKMASQKTAAGNSINELKKELSSAVEGASRKTGELSGSVQTAVGEIKKIKGSITQMGEELGRLKKEIGPIREQMSDLLRRLEEFKKEEEEPKTAAGN